MKLHVLIGRCALLGRLVCQLGRFLCRFNAADVSIGLGQE
jgi:hypothetical protein